MAMDVVKVLQRWWPQLTATAAAALAIALWRRSQKKKISWPKDTVILHQFGRGPWAPNFSPWPVKLETYLRMAKIPFIVNLKGGFSKKHKTPWISYNDEDIADSQFCIDYLNDKFKVDLNQHLTDEQRATAHAFRCLVEDNLYWCGVMFRYKYNVKIATDMFHKLWPGFVSYFVIEYRIPRMLRDQAWKQGTGRHSKEEVLNICERNVKALSDFIGSKPFLTGDEPCEEDCTMFGFLCQVVWQLQGTLPEKWVNEKYPNLRAYCLRMKEKFWPDWDDCITHGWTRQPLK